jgi:hypothetical protein
MAKLALNRAGLVSFIVTPYNDASAGKQTVTRLG